MKKPKKVWIVFDACDGPHLFRSLKEAQRIMKQWRKKAKDNNWDSYWDMSDITEYIYNGTK